MRLACRLASAKREQRARVLAEAFAPHPERLLGGVRDDAPLAHALHCRLLAA
jgi:hypothetical protein